MNKKLVVKTAENGPLSENTYFVYYENEDIGFLVDPGMDSRPIDNVIGDKKVSFILLTHSHFDHILTVNQYKEKYNCPIYVSEYENESLKDPNKNLSRMFHCDYFVSDAVELKGTEGEIKNDNFNIKYFLTKGHTIGGLCYYLEEDKVMFTGDTMFKGTYGRTDLPGGNDLEMEESLKKIFTYSDDIMIYPGHGEPCTLKENKKLLYYNQEDL